MTEPTKLTELMYHLVETTSEDVAAHSRARFIALSSLVGTENAAAVLIKANHIVLTAMAGAAFGDHNPEKGEPNAADAKLMKDLSEIGRQYLERCLEHLKERRDNKIRSN